MPCLFLGCTDNGQTLCRYNCWRIKQRPVRQVCQNRKINTFFVVWWKQYRKISQWFWARAKRKLSLRSGWHFSSVAFHLLIQALINTFVLIASKRNINWYNYISINSNDNIAYKYCLSPQTMLVDAFGLFESLLWCHENHPI